MGNLEVRSGIVLIEIYGCFILVADKEARNACVYIRKINETGAIIWRSLSEGKDIEEIVSLLHEEYEIPESVDLKKEVILFIENLKANNYLTNGEVEK